MMDIQKALAIADFCEDEGVISTTAMALRVLAKSYREVKNDLDAAEYEQNKGVPALLKNSCNNLRKIE